VQEEGLQSLLAELTKASAIRRADQAPQKDAQPEAEGDPVVSDRTGAARRMQDLGGSILRGLTRHRSKSRH
jgi:hypothetical protein